MEEKRVNEDRSQKEYAEQEKRNARFRPAAEGMLREKELRFFFWLCAGVILAAVLFYKHDTLKRPVFLRMDREEMMTEDRLWECIGEEAFGSSGSGENEAEWMATEDTSTESKGTEVTFWIHIPIYYIQDQEDSSRITAVEFPELDGIGEFRVKGGMKEDAWSLFSSYYQGGFQGQKYGIYEIGGEIWIPQSQWPEKGVVLKKIRVFCDDGSVFEEDIGKLHLRALDDSGIMEGRSASVSSDGSTSSTYWLRQDCRLDSVGVGNQEQLCKEMDIRINGKELWQGTPVELKKGDFLKVETIQKSDGTVLQSLEPMTAFWNSDLQWQEQKMGVKRAMFRLSGF